jgi:hypothetical protein
MVLCLIESDRGSYLMEKNVSADSGKISLLESSWKIHIKGTKVYNHCSETAKKIIFYLFTATLIKKIS